jgi:hypothetical protein
MKKVLLYLLVIICLALAVLGILYLLQQEAPAVDAPFLVRTVLLALGIAAGLAAALYVSRRILSLSRAAREEAALDLDELTVKESRSESLPVFLARLSRDLGALSRGQDSFLIRLESLLAKPAQTPPPAAGEVSSAGAVSAEKEALLREIARSLLGTAGREDFYRRALSIAAGVSRSRRASIMLVNTERTGLAVHATLGWDPDKTVLRTTFPLDGCLSGSVVRRANGCWSPTSRRSPAVTTAPDTAPAPSSFFRFMTMVR